MLHNTIGKLPRHLQLKTIVAQQKSENQEKSHDKVPLTQTSQHKSSQPHHTPLPSPNRPDGNEISPDP